MRKNCWSWNVLELTNKGLATLTSKKNQFIEALTDYRSWLLVIYALSSNIPNGGLTNFSGILLYEDFQYSEAKSLLMQMPQGAVEIVGCVLLAWCSRIHFISIIDDSFHNEFDNHVRMSLSVLS